MKNLISPGGPEILDKPDSPPHAPITLDESFSKEKACINFEEIDCLTQESFETLAKRRFENNFNLNNEFCKFPLPYYFTLIKDSKGHSSIMDAISFLRYNFVYDNEINPLNRQSIQDYKIFVISSFEDKVAKLFCSKIDLLIREKNDKEAEKRKKLIFATDNSNADDQFCVADLFEKGDKELKIEKDAGNAIHWYKFAASNKNYLSFIKLAGLSNDPNQAIKYLEDALHTGLVRKNQIRKQLGIAFESREREAKEGLLEAEKNGNNLKAYIRSLNTLRFEIDNISIRLSLVAIDLGGIAFEKGHVYVAKKYFSLAKDLSPETFKNAISQLNENDQLLIDCLIKLSFI